MVILDHLSKYHPNRISFLPFLHALANPIGLLTAIHAHQHDVVFTRLLFKKIIFVRSPEHIQEICEQEAMGRVNRDFLYGTKKPLFGDSLYNSKRAVWKPQRKLIASLITKELMDFSTAAIFDEAMRLSDSLQGNYSGYVNISREIRFTTYRILSKILLGDSDKVSTEMDDLVMAIEKADKDLLLKFVSQIATGGMLTKLIPSFRKNHDTSVSKITEFFKDIVSQKQNYPGNDLTSLLLSAHDPETGYRMSKELVTDEILSLFIIGFDTLANVLQWFFYLNGRHPEIHCKLTEEIKNCINEELTFELLGTLNYTRATLHETLRLYPPIPGISVQTVKDITVNGNTAPKGTVIILNIFATHRNPTLWQRPNEFDPEHFLVTANHKSKHKYAFFPYGGGIHNCIGRHVAERVMMTVIVALLRQFSFKTDIDIQPAISVTLKPNQDIYLYMDKI